MRPIHKIIEPDTLALVWQAIDSERRKRFVVGKITRTPDGAILEYLSNSDVEEARNLGFQGYPAFPRLTKKYSDSVMNSFVRRLPPRSRRDFSKYLGFHGISTDVEISDFALLGYTGAKLPHDGFSFVHPFDTDEDFEFVIEVAGFRHRDNIHLDDLEIGMQAFFQPEPDNPKDPNAIKIVVENKHIGYVDRGRNLQVKQWMAQDRSIKAQIFRFNGTEKRPLVYLILIVSAVLEKAGGS
ncbi:MAG: HIRAN domain-containing protein [Balneolales bacterium]